MNKDEFRKLIKDDIITACMIASTVIWKEKMSEVSQKEEHSNGVNILLEIVRK